MSQQQSMRRQDKEVTDPQIIQDILRGNFTCRVAFSHPKEPYLLPLHYGYHKDCLYFHSARNGKKVDLVRANPLVCVEISDSIEIQDGEQACEYGTRFRSLLVWGKGELELPEVEAREGLKAIMHQHTGRRDWDFPENMLQRTLVWKIIPMRFSAKISG